jgi:hypothetical protein
MTNINIELNDDLHKEIKITSAINGITLKELVHAAVDGYLKDIRDKGYVLDSASKSENTSSPSKKKK